MELSSIGGIDPGSVAAAGRPESVQSANARDAFTAARKLNGLNITDREYSVVRDPASQLFKVVVLDKTTGEVLDQFPPEDILQMLVQLSSAATKNTGEGSK